MKPHRLAFCALGPYADEVEIDFDPLIQEGLFLIHGPTGAGKTFLLDALCFALYGDVPGARRRHTLRSDHAPPTVSPWAELEFTSRGHRWRVRRSPEHEAVKVRGEGTTRRLAEATLERREGDSWRAVAQKIREVNGEITEMLGLTAQQFQQVILLPQGRFEQVLRSDSDDRQKLLQTLFDTTIFGAASEWLDSKAKRRQEAASRHEDELANIRRQAAERWRSVTDEPDAEESWPTDSPADEADTEESWPADQAALDELVQHAESLKENAAAGATAADKSLREIHSAHNTILQAAKHWDRRVTLRKSRITLDEEQPAIDADRETLRLADAAEALRQVIDDDQSHREELDTLTPLVTKLLTAIAERCDEALSLPDDLAVPAAGEPPALNELNAMIPVLAAHRTELKRFTDDAEEATGLETSAVAQAAKQAALDKQVDTAKQQWMDAKQDTLDRRTEVLDLRQRRLDGIAAELAGTLTDTEPCPVCGSTDHPNPAEPADHAVDTQDMEAADEAVAGAEEAEELASEARQQLAGRATKLRLNAETTAKAAATLRARIAEAIGDIDQLVRPSRWSGASAQGPDSPGNLSRRTGATSRRQVDMEVLFRKVRPVGAARHPGNQGAFRVGEVLPDVPVGGIAHGLLHRHAGVGLARLHQFQRPRVVRSVARQHLHGGDQLSAGVHHDGRLVPVEPFAAALASVAHLRVMHRHHTVLAHPVLEAHSVIGTLHVLEQQLTQQLCRRHYPLTLLSVLRQPPLRLTRQLQQPVRVSQSRPAVPSAPACPTSRWLPPP